MRIRSWMVAKSREPMVLEEREESVGPNEVLVKVAGCGVCHTDLGFFYEGIPTRHPFPLTLGHEISGRVVEAGRGAESWIEKEVVIPAVIPCGSCEACKDRRGSVCPNQIFPGNHIHGGFASHLKIPASGLCAVPNLKDSKLNPNRLDLASLSVIADAVSTPYQAVIRSGLREGDLAIFVGVGGVGGFGVQIAAALGAVVIALDVNPEKLKLAAEHGASLALRSDEWDAKEIKKQIRAFAKERGISSWRHKIFETSGTPMGQTTAFGLLSPGAHLSIIGYTPDRVVLPLSNLMAFDATVQGNWGCLPEHYPAVLKLVLSKKFSLSPFIEKRPLSSINQVFSDIHDRKVSRRIVLVPEN